MKTLSLVMGLFFLSGGILIKYFDEFLTRTQGELNRHGFKNVNLHSPFRGPRPYFGIVYIIVGLGLLLLYFLKEFDLL